MSQEQQEENDALEKQRLSLEAMSNQLTDNLNLMIAQQEQRVKQFISVETAESTQFFTAAPKAQPPVAAAPAPTISFTPQAQVVIQQVPTPPPGLPTMHQEAKPKPKTQRSYRQQVLDEIEEEAQKKPTLKTPAQEDSIGVGHIIAFVVLVIFFIRGCAG